MDQDFNLKIADFGFAALLAGRDGSGTMRTHLGTVGFKAPEIEDGKEYSGAEVDIFAAAVMLFIMMTQHPPFASSKLDDPYYKCIRHGRADIFWRSHQRTKAVNFFSEHFINLFTRLIAADPQ